MLKSTLDYIFKAKDVLVHSNYIDPKPIQLINSNIDDTIESAGGATVGDFRVTLLWYNTDDLDLHLQEPSGNVIYYSRKTSSLGGFLDLDANAGSPLITNPIENIVYPLKSKLTPGNYTIKVDQYSKRESTKVGFILRVVLDGKESIYDYRLDFTGRTVDMLIINFNGTSFDITYTHPLLSLRAPVVVDKEEGESTSKKIDSSSVVKKKHEDVIKEKLKERGVRVYKGDTFEDLALQEYTVETKLETIEKLQNNLSEKIDEVNELVRTRIIDLRTKLDNCRENVKQALLAEKKLIGETYTAIIPIETNYTTPNTTAIVEDGVILGAGYDTGKVVETALQLDTVNIIAEESTKFRISGKTNEYPLVLSVNKNLYNPYNQVKIVLPTITQSGILLIKFDKVEAISVLDRDGYEIVSKHINNIVKFPVDSSSRSFSLRFLDNTRRDIQINAMYFTEAIYNKTTVYETFPIDINKQLSYLTIESCDNYATSDVDIKYEISINGEDYEEYRPSGKLKNKVIQSIIRTDKFGYNEPVILENPEKDENVFKFYPANPIAQSSRLKAFSLKLGTDVYSAEAFFEPSSVVGFLMDETYDEDRWISIEDRRKSMLFITKGVEDVMKLHIVVKETFDLYINEGSFIILNGIKYKFEDTVDGAVTITKGLHTIEFLRHDWKETIDLEVYALTEIGDDYLEGTHRETGIREKVDFYFNPKEKQFNSLYIQFWLQQTDIYMFEEPIKRKYSNSYIEYFYKDNPYKTYLLNESPSKIVDTIQIRATMKSVNEVVCPYISKIIVRGI